MDLDPLENASPELLNSVDAMGGQALLKTIEDLVQSNEERTLEWFDALWDIKVQCKSAEGKVGSPEVSGLLGTLAHNERGLFVTLGRFSPDAVNLGRDRTNLRLIDGQELVDLVLEHYNAFGAEYEAKLPMRRVYFPDAAAA